MPGEAGGFGRALASVTASAAAHRIEFLADRALADGVTADEERMS